LLKPYINGCFVADAQELNSQTLVLFINAGVDEGNTQRLFIVEDRNHTSTKHLPEKLKVFGGDICVQELDRGGAGQRY